MTINELRIIKSNLPVLDGGIKTLEKIVDELLSYKVQELLRETENRVNIFIKESDFYYNSINTNIHTGAITLGYDFGATLVFKGYSISGFTANSIGRMELTGLKSAQDYLKFVKAMNDAKHT